MKLREDPVQVLAPTRDFTEAPPDGRLTSPAAPMSGLAQYTPAPWEGLEGEFSSGDGHAGGGSARACDCDLDICSHHRDDNPAAARLTFDEDLIRETLLGFNSRWLLPPKNRRERDASGKRSQATSRQARGRHIRSVPLTQSRDIAWPATIRAGAVHRMRRPSGPLAIPLAPADLFAKIRRRKVGNLLLFVMDTSASMGVQRRAIATQAAIMAILLDAYQRRDRVGLVVFRDQQAEVVLQPTNSVDLARRAFERMELGGTTPLSAGLMAALRIVEREGRRKRDLAPLLIILTDGQANISQGDQDPLEEALLVARHMRAKRVGGVVLGTEVVASQQAPLRALASALGAGYVPMGEITHRAILTAIRSLQSR